MRLEKKGTLVTGASRGIGFEIARRFLLEGASVLAVSTKESPRKAELDEAAAASGARVDYVYADAAGEEAMAAAVATAVERFGALDVVVANAGISRDALFMRASVADFEATLSLNLTGAFVLAKAAARHMIGRRRGSIIIMSSVVGLRGNAGQCAYAASKAGAIGLAKSLAKEVAGRGVRVNAIAPGFIETDMTGALPAAVKDAYRGQIPLGRFGSAADIAAAALYLASDESAYVTGSVLSVDGGMGM